MMERNSLFLLALGLLLAVSGSLAQMSSSDTAAIKVVAETSNELEDTTEADSSDEEAPAECGECDPKSCPPSPLCRAGFQTDACGCCSVCAASVGEKCDMDPSNYKYGMCGDNLDCKIRQDNQATNEPEATCVCTEDKLVCGTDGKTYANICELREATNMLRSAPQDDAAGDQEVLSVSEWGPCEEVPTITSKPEDARVEQGGNVALACEAKGWPVPVITWETVRADGSQFILPSDHTTIAVQQRGGPERLMVSGWVQLMEVQPGDGGTYTCVATNKLGEARVSTQVGIYKESDAQVGSNDNKV